MVPVSSSKSKIRTPNYQSSYTLRGATKATTATGCSSQSTTKQQSNKPNPILSYPSITRRRTNKKAASTKSCLTNEQVQQEAIFRFSTTATTTTINSNNCPPWEQLARTSTTSSLNIMQQKQKQHHQQDHRQPHHHRQHNNINPAAMLSIAIGLGTFNIPKQLMPVAIETATRTGYRRIDCAPVYFNEDAVGDALHVFLDSGTVGVGVDVDDDDVDSTSRKRNDSSNLIRREDLYMVSKLASPFHRREHVKVGLQKTLADLRTDYLDLFLIHWPQAFYFKSDMVDMTVRGYTNEDIDDSDDGNNIDTAVSIHETWSAMEDLVDEGLVKSIGVSNFPVSLLHELMTRSRIHPAVNQVELHPYLQQEKLLKYCQRRGVHVQAYSPLGTPGYREETEPSILDDPVLNEIASNHSTTVATICLTWAIQRGTSVVVKSSTPSRIEENWKSVLRVSTSESGDDDDVSNEDGTCNATNNEKGDKSNEDNKHNEKEFAKIHTNIRLSSEEMERIKALDKGYRFFRPDEWWGELGMAVFD